MRPVGASQARWGSPVVPPCRFRGTRWTRSYSSAFTAVRSIPQASARTKPRDGYQGARDHRAIGVQQELFAQTGFSPGSPLFLPNGARIFNKLVTFLRAQYQRFGFLEVITPSIYKSSLWRASGHWKHYKEDMYEVFAGGKSEPLAYENEDPEAETVDRYGLKPMNCPGHCILFSARKRSYRELPIRYADFGRLHRNEASGALSGLTRLRGFHQDDGHIFCRPSQIEEEIAACLQFVQLVYTTFGLPPFKLVLSTRPEKDFIGTIEEWQRAEDALEKALNASGQEWTRNPGDGAFYGPKIDIILKDPDGKAHQTATIQLDFQLPQRLGLQYYAPAPEQERDGVKVTEDDIAPQEAGPVTPVMIHRAIVGSVERFMAILAEHYNARWPFWLSPNQAIILTTGTRNAEFDEHVERSLHMIRGLTGSPRLFRNRSLGAFPEPPNRHMFQVDLDDSTSTLAKKLAEARQTGYQAILIIGPTNVERKNATMDITRQHDYEGALDILDQQIGRERTVDGSQATMSASEIYKYFCHLANTYK